MEMPSRNIVIVAFNDQPNLGVGYMASILLDHGFHVELLNFRDGPQAICGRIRELNPLLIGLSIIFQYYTPDFAELAGYLRRHGVTSVICAGGHYPSLEPAETLESIKDLDFVVRFEGEHTLLEVAERLHDGRDWNDVRSIAYKNHDRLA
jgi:radical SAM superfamily enzyme YgiQ (UPF0313 family)